MSPIIHLNPFGQVGQKLRNLLRLLYHSRLYPLKPILFSLLTLDIFVHTMYTYEHKILWRLEMNTSEKQLLDKFKTIYFKKYGIQLSEKEVTEQAESFLNLMRILIKPTRNINLTYE